MLLFDIWNLIVTASLHIFKNVPSCFLDNRSKHFVSSNKMESSITVLPGKTVDRQIVVGKGKSGGGEEETSAHYEVKGSTKATFDILW